MGIIQWFFSLAKGIWRGSSKASAPATPQSQTAKTFDLSARAWGNNYEILDNHGEGMILSLAVWMPDSPREGDYLILRNGEHTTRYLVTDVEACRDPNDMAFVEVVFAPRTA